MVNKQISAISYRFVENRSYVSLNTVVITMVHGFMYPLPPGSAGAFIYYCASFRLCIGGQAALASAGIMYVFELMAYLSIYYRITQTGGLASKK